MGKADAPVTVEIYFDYMCPACGAFEAANGDELDRLLEAGVVRVELRPLSFLDDQSNGTAYSTRAANAIATVADAAPGIDGEVFAGDVYTPGPLTAAIESAADGR